MARSFNGSTDAFFADIGTGAPTGLATGAAFSMACWFKLVSLPAGTATLLGKGFDGTSTNYFFQTDATPNLAVGSFNGSTFGTTTAYTPGTGVWTHIYGDWDTTQWNLYFNGTLITFGSTHGPSAISVGRAFTMAAADTGGFTGGQWTNCQMADCAVWNGPLNSTDIGNISGKTLGGGANSAGRANTATNTGRTLLGYWPLNGSGSTENDLSGNNKTASQAGTPGVVSDPIQLQPFGFGSIVMMPASLRMT